MSDRVLTRYSGTLANNADTSAANFLSWDEGVGPGGDPAGQGVITVTTSVAMTLHVREAATMAELDTPYGGLHHQFSEAVPANSTRRVIIGQDSSLPCGKAWLANASGGPGNYSYTGSRRLI